jgi:hypothetical protein
MARLMARRRLGLVFAEHASRWETKAAALFAPPVAPTNRCPPRPLGSSVAMNCEGTMTADTTLERQAAIDERRAAYEADVVHALLDETPDEREERLDLVRLAHEMILRVLGMDDEPVAN